MPVAPVAADVEADDGCGEDEDVPDGCELVELGDGAGDELDVLDGPGFEGLGGCVEEVEEPDGEGACEVEDPEGEGLLGAGVLAAPELLDVPDVELDDGGLVLDEGCGEVWWLPGEWCVRVGAGRCVGAC